MKSSALLREPGNPIGGNNNRSAIKRTARRSMPDFRKTNATEHPEAHRSLSENELKELEKYRCYIYINGFSLFEL